MPASEWVLDTWLLEIAQNPADSRSLDALVLLRQILELHRIGVDHGYEILREYFDHVSEDSHVGKWLQLMLSRSDKIMYRAGNVSSRHSKKLLNDLGFDPADMVFVGVAVGGPDKNLVSEESDYSHEVKTYLSTEMGIDVLSVGDALIRSQDP